MLAEERFLLPAILYTDYKGKVVHVP